MVFVQGDLRIGGTTIISHGKEQNLAVEMHETIPPAVTPVPMISPLAIPEYSEAAIAGDRWAKAWLLLDVDEKGNVVRLKLLDRPGMDLDQIAVRYGFKLRFKPARDLSDRPVGAQVLWAFEWPAYWWLHEETDNLELLPRAVFKMPCRGTGPARNGTYRDCSQATLANAITEPWFDRPKK